MVELKSGKVAYHDELSALKDSVKRLRIINARALPSTVRDLPGLLHCEANGNNAVLSVEQFHPELPERLSHEWQAEVTVEDLNLEEIFLELHHG